MPPLVLTNLKTQKYDIGRVAVFMAAQWDGTTPLMDALAHVGNTEGAVEFDPGTEYSVLTLPENLGPAPLKKYVTGEAPSFELNLFANEENLERFSPTGTASGGTMRQRSVTESTMWLVPEQLFIKKVDGRDVEVDIEYTGTEWLKDGVPFTAEDVRLWNMGMFCWRTHTERLTAPYRHEDAGKSLKSVMVHLMPDLNKPDGHLLWTVGFELAGSGIDLAGETS